VTFRTRLLLLFLLAFTSLLPGMAPAQALPPAHENFKVAVYIPVSVVEQMKDPAWLASSWNEISSQVKVDKVYIESYRSGVLADDALLESVKAYFAARGVQTAGGIAFTNMESNQFASFCYTDPKDRAYVKHISEVTARHFDEIILDDFFFNDTKSDSDIAAKGNASWTAFRLRLMDEVARNLVVGAARAVNPNVKIIIKFPNWYEHFQANGYDLEQEPKIFDGIYTGTETRDPVINDQHLQQYESYQILRYFDNVKPGGNGGGWVDTFTIRYLDRYAEQLWDTMLAKTPEITLFQYSNLLRPAEAGDPQRLERPAHQLRLRRAGKVARRLRLEGADRLCRRGRLFTLQSECRAGQAGHAHRHRQLQALSIYRRGFPAQLYGHDRHSHRPASRVSG